MDEQVNSTTRAGNSRVGISPKHHLIFSLVSLIILILVAGGIYSWQHTKVNSLNQQVSSLRTQVSSLNAQVSTLNKQLPIPILTTASVKDLLTNFYTQFFKAEEPGTGSDQINGVNNAIKQFGTTSLYNYENPSSGAYSENPIACAQDLPPSGINSISVSDIVLKSNSATAIVNEAFDLDPADTVKINVTVVNQSGSLKIDSIYCNPPLVASKTPS